MKKLLGLLLLLAAASQTTLAQEEVDPRELREAEMAQVFRSNMAGIVDDMNRGSFSRYIMAIDQDDLFERIFGLRLITPKLKRDWREMQEARFPQFIAGVYAQESEDGLKATLINVESRGDRGRAIVRFDMTFFRVNYVEYDLRLDANDRLIIIDWRDYYWGHQFTEFAGLMLIAAHPKESAIRKLFDFNNVNPTQLFQAGELLKAGGSQNYQRFMQIFDQIDDRTRQQYFVLKMGLDTTRIRRKRREQRVILESVAEFHPENPFFSLSLMDYYLPTEQYELAHESLLRLQDHLSIDDAMMNARLSSTALILNRIDEAASYAERSVEQESDLELGWWSLLRVRAQQQAHEEAVEILSKLETDFGHALSPQTLHKDPAFRQLVRSPEFQAWRADNPIPTEE